MSTLKWLSHFFKTNFNISLILIKQIVNIQFLENLGDYKMKKIQITLSLSIIYYGELEYIFKILIASL